MPVIFSFLAVLLFTAARYVGEHYGWYYHALIIVIVGFSLMAFFRLTMPKPPNPMRELPPTDDPERRRVQKGIRSLHENLVQSYPTFRRDMLLLPIVACVPTAVMLCVLQQRSYLSDNLIWFRLSLIPFLFYFVFCFLIPKRSKKA
jgi:hypothetical protein